MTETPTARPEVTRRAVVAGAGAAALGATLVVAGCAGSGGSSAVVRSGDPLGAAADVPVGGAKIFDGAGVVVTQANAGSYTGFSTICPHQGCTVNQVRGATLECPCHGSEFDLDGSVRRGPATRGLDPQAVTVSGGQIILG